MTENPDTKVESAASRSNDHFPDALAPQLKIEMSETNTENGTNVAEPIFMTETIDAKADDIKNVSGTSCNHGEKIEPPSDDIDVENLAPPVVIKADEIENKSESQILETETKVSSVVVKIDCNETKDLKNLTEIKQELLESKVKTEPESTCHHLDSQQTRNLFETVGLVLRSNPSASPDDPENQQERVMLGGDMTENQAIEPNTVPVQSQPLQGQPSYCKFCGFPASNPDILEKHMRFHDRTNTQFTCFLCGWKYRTREPIMEHYANQHGIPSEKMHKCESCKYVSSDELSFQEHVRQHFLIRPHGCGICYQTFVTVHNFHRHMDKHTDDEHRNAGYTRPIPRRKRGASASQARPSSSVSKRSRQKSKNEETKNPSAPIPTPIPTPIPSSEDSSSRSKAVKQKPPEPSPETSHAGNTAPVKETVSVPIEVSKPESSQSVSEANIKPRNHFVLPTKAINLVCAFCEITTLSKRDLSQHLLSFHGDEVISLKPPNI